MTLVDAATLHAWQREKHDFVLIDVLPASTFEKGHIPGALHIVSDDILALAPQRLPDRNQLIVVYCTSARCQRAGLAAERLQRLGYRRVHHFSGGKREWLAAGLPLHSAGTVDAS